MAKSKYDDSSIKSLKGPDRVRLRPSVIFGSDDIVGCCHSFFEILSNSIDEFKEGHGNKIIVSYFNDGSVEVQDFGRGIPVDYNEKEKAYNWELLFCEMYAGGKYGDTYEFSLGLNGLGLCATQYASEYMEAEIYNGKYRYELRFEKGYPVCKNKEEQMHKTEMKHKPGTRIKWRPDLSVFTDINMPLSYFEDTLKKQAICNNGLTILLKYQNPDGSITERTFYYENGISDYLAEITGSDTLTSPQVWSAERFGRDRADKDDYRVILNVAFCFSNKYPFIEYYHNSSFLEYGGSPDKAVKSAFVSAIDSYIKSVGKYNKNESKIAFSDIEDSLALVSNSYSTQTSYENQTKKSINNKFIQEAMTDFLKHHLEVYFIENKEEANKIADQVLVNKRSRENAEKTRQTLKKKLITEIDLTNRIEKFVPCRSKDVSKRELYIVEGDSAVGSVKQARDAEFQAIMPVRGKILNCLKADINKILNSEIITNLVRILGCGVEMKIKGKSFSEFNLQNLKFSKIIICTDADFDGYQIRTLILAMIYSLMPTLIDEKKVFIAESPLYEITNKDKTYFAYTDREKTEIVSKLEGKVNVQRSKGLGENEPDMMKLTTMDPETRKLLLITPEAADVTFQYFDVLLGNNLQGRKELISEKGNYYLELADIS
ncbi:MAG: DNA topoisomerase [Clostridiales bacterium]|nr:DNA topoisomerase [Clostridiales bacterium]